MMKINGAIEKDTRVMIDSEYETDHSLVMSRVNHEE